MKNPIKEIKQKIKVAKVSGVIFAIVFLALIVNSICLTYKVHKLEKDNYNYSGVKSHDKNTCGSKTCNKSEGQTCGNH